MHFETDQYVGIVLADGATGCSKGDIGARIACETVAQIFQTEADTFFSYENRKAAYLLIEQVLYNIERCKSSEENIRDYGSTLIVACLNKKTSEIILINLGDGAVIEAGDNKYTVILGPKQYRDPKIPEYKGPCLTVTQDAAGATDVTRIDLPLESSIILASDGYLNLFSKPDARQKMTRSLSKCDFHSMNICIDKTDSIDDCTYIALTRTRR